MSGKEKYDEPSQPQDPPSVEVLASEDQIDGAALASDPHRYVHVLAVAVDRLSDLNVHPHSHFMSS